MKKFLIVSCAVAVLGGIIFVLVPYGEDVAKTFDQAKAGTAKNVHLIETTSETVTIELDATNTNVRFSCAKDVAGKTLTVHGGWSAPFGSTLTGQVLIDGKERQVQRIEAKIDIGSVWSEHDMLTDALLTKGFFQVKEHPTGTFVSTSIRDITSEESVMKGATHWIEGNFSLNGVEKSISFPAKIELSDAGLKCDSQFSLNRKDFNVNFVDSAGFGLLTDENISHLVGIKLTIDVASPQAPTPDDNVVSTEDPAEAEAPTPDEPAEDPAEPQTPASAIDVSTLPKTYTETVPATQVEFSMTLVPGDSDKKVAPLYFGTHEVTWDEFMPWVDGRDIDDEGKMGELRALKLRPSPPYGSVDRNFGMDQRPALGMSLLSAQLYCQWLSKQTDKKYRLPTEAEWEHAYALGGGDLKQPLDAETADRTAVYEDNAWDDDIGDWASKPVGSMEPNTIGLYDMAGNVCEWVSGTGEDRVARGGHYDGQLDLLGVGRQVEDAEWNRDYPNEPKSIWWFVNARWVGFRVVCEVSADAKVGD